MHKAVKHYRTHAFLRKLFRIKSPSDCLPSEPILKAKTDKQVNKGLERLSKAIKEM